MSEAKEEKKPVLVRLPPKIFKALLREASQESVKRGETMTVPRLILEILEDWTGSNNTRK